MVRQTANVVSTPTNSKSEVSPEYQTSGMVAAIISKIARVGAPRGFSRPHDAGKSPFQASAATTRPLVMTETLRVEMKSRTMTPVTRRPPNSPKILRAAVAPMLAIG